jgi:cell division protein FtsW (lipid II flippase)
MTKLQQVLSTYLLIVITFLFGLLTWQSGTVTYKGVLIYVSIISAVYWVCFLVVFLLRKTKILGKMQWIVGIGSLLMLAATLFMGEVRYGSKRWLFGIQTSEIAKGFLLPLFYESEWSYVPVGILSALLIILHPDLGTGLVVFSSVGIFFLTTKANKMIWDKVWVGLIALIIILPCIFVYSMPERQEALSRLSGVPFLFAHWQDRFENWSDPLQDPFGKSYQTLSALNSLGQSAGFGKSIGLMTALPVSLSDYAFAELVRKYGILAGLLLLFLFGALLEAVLNWGGRSKYYVASVIILHVIINLYTVANVLRATGIPLPFVGRALQNSVVLSAMIGAVLGE